MISPTAFIIPYFSRNSKYIRKKTAQRPPVGRKVCLHITNRLMLRLESDNLARVTLTRAANGGEEKDHQLCSERQQDEKMRRSASPRAARANRSKRETDFFKKIRFSP